jgi:hypothetical protein
MAKSNQPQTAAGNRLLKPAEAAELLNVSIDTLSRWRMLGGGPKFCKFFQSKQAIIRYRQSDLEAFIGRSLRRSTSDTASDVRR